MNLLSSHSMNLINIRIDHIDDACMPFNLTNTSLMCLLSKSALNDLEDSEAHVEVRIEIHRKKNVFFFNIF